MEKTNSPLRVGWAVCGSFCTLEPAVSALERYSESTGAEMTPIMSEAAYSTTTRFGTADYWRSRITRACGGRKIITGVSETEPIGPKKLLDLLIVAPCTSNTLAKMAHGICDSGVLMAVKAHLRNERPVVIALATNDALSASAPNIGVLLGRRQVYFVPFAQDDPSGKPRSCIADFSKVEATAEAALRGEQIQPIIF